MSEEEWRPVVGWEGLYEVSDLGRVRSLDRRCYAGRGHDRLSAGRIMKTPINNAGYPVAGLTRVGGAMTLYLVHRLVALAFLPYSCKRQVNHIDGIKSNPVLTNLEWSTQAENMMHSCRVLGHNRGEKQGRSKLRNDQIPRIIALRALGFRISDIASLFHVSRRTIGLICNGHTWMVVKEQMLLQPASVSVSISTPAVA